MKSGVQGQFSEDSKYYPLHAYLSSMNGSHLKLSFEDVEEVLGITLPPGARSNAAWWGNSRIILSREHGFWLVGALLKWMCT